MDVRSVGVEEELLLVEPGTGQPRAVAAAVLRASTGPGHAPDSGGPDPGQELEHELQLQQVETSTRPCSTLEELGGELREARAAAAEAAERVGVQVVALATSPISVEPETTTNPRYRRMTEAFGLTAQEQLTCGCHVHVQIDSDEEGVAVLDRIQPWLATLLALSGNSPVLAGAGQFLRELPVPGLGPLAVLGAYRVARLGAGLPGHGAADGGHRDAAGQRHGVLRRAALPALPTLEVRIADVCLRHEDAVLIAALVRALVETEGRAWRQGAPPLRMRAELLRLAAWRASRSGLDGELIDPRTGRPGGAAAVTALLLAHVRDALADVGDLGTVTGLLTEVLRRGTGAAFQREAFRRTGRLRDVVASSAEVLRG